MKLLLFADDIYIYTKILYQRTLTVNKKNSEKWLDTKLTKKKIGRPLLYKWKLGWARNHGNHTLHNTHKQYKILWFNSNLTSENTVWLELYVSEERSWRRWTDLPCSLISRLT